MPHDEHDFTLARWDVHPGREDDFIDAWERLAETFSALDEPPLWGTLLRSTTEPSLFYSFGPWRDRAHIAAMREDPRAQAGFKEIADLCTAMSPGSYELVRHVTVPEPR